jgi:hypothetical protein
MPYYNFQKHNPGADINEPSIYIIRVVTSTKRTGVVDVTWVRVPFKLSSKI